MFAHNFTSYLIVATLDGAALSASVAADVALLRRVGGEEETTFRAQTQAVLNVGISLGVATAGVAIEINTENAYRALFLGHALTCLPRRRVDPPVRRPPPGCPASSGTSPWVADRAYRARLAVPVVGLVQPSAILGDHAELMVDDRDISAGPFGLRLVLRVGEGLPASRPA